MFKTGFSPFKKNCFVCFTGSPLKMVKNAFYFILKALFLLRVLNFLSWLFFQVEKAAWLEKDKVNFKVHNVTTWLTNICNPYISRSKSNQTLNFGQSIEYNKIKFFSKNHAQNEAERLLPDLFLFFKKAS